MIDLNKLTHEQLAILSLSRSWKACLCDPNGQLSRAGRRCIRDLVRFCRGTSSAFTPEDNEITLAFARRREVLNRILDHLHLDESRIHQLMMEEDDD